MGEYSIGTVMSCTRLYFSTVRQHFFNCIKVQGSHFVEKKFILY